MDQGDKSEQLSLRGQFATSANAQPHPTKDGRSGGLLNLCLMFFRQITLRHRL
jgi:hypothetical protein